MTKPVTPQDVFDMWQKMVNPGAYPLQSLMFPVLDANEIEKKISELETVEHWLKANLNMLQLTIKSMQYQLAMVKGSEKAQEILAGKEEAKPAEGEVPNPAAWAWKMMAEASRGGAAAMKAAGDAAAKPDKPRAKKKKKKQES